MSTELPPPGPERDRLVAEALGCTTWAKHEPGYLPRGCDCDPAPDPVALHNVAIGSSTDNHAALEALEAWKRGGRGRRVRIEMGNNWYMGEHYAGPFRRVTLWMSNGRPVLGDVAPTLGDAASRAIIEAGRRGG